MPLTTCQVCDRRFKDDREDCPYCGALSAARVTARDLPNRAGRAPRGWRGTLISLVVVLLALNVWRSLNRDFGPDPEVEALHSEAAAIDVCVEAVKSQLVDPTFLGPGRPEYLQGGEYDVWLNVEVQEGRRRTRDDILCQVQFTVETGWIVEEISVGSK